MNQAVICPDTDLEVTATSDMHNVTFVWTLPMVQNGMVPVK